MDLRRRRRRHRAVVARRSPARDRVGGRAMRAARRAGRVRRPHRVEDAPNCSNLTATSSSTASPSTRAMRLAAGEVAERHRRSAEPIDDLDALPFPRWDLVGDATARRWSRALRRPPRRRRDSAAREPRLSGVLHLLSAPDPGGVSQRARSSNILDELSASRDAAATSVRRLPRSAVHARSATACLELCDGILARGLDLTFECETRLDRLDAGSADADASRPACAR